MDLGTIHNTGNKYCTNIMVSALQCNMDYILRYFHCIFIFIWIFYQIVNSYVYNCSIIFVFGIGIEWWFSCWDVEPGKALRRAIPSSRWLLNSLIRSVFNILSDKIHMSFGLLLTVPLYVGLIFCLDIGFFCCPFLL